MPNSHRRREETVEFRRVAGVNKVGDSFQFRSQCGGSFLDAVTIRYAIGKCLFASRRRRYDFILFMAALWNRAGHIFALWFLSSIYLSFFPRLISAAADRMSTILPHMVWP